MGQTNDPKLTCWLGLVWIWAWLELALKEWTRWVHVPSYCTCTNKEERQEAFLILFFPPSFFSSPSLARLNNGGGLDSSNRGDEAKILAQIAVEAARWATAQIATTARIAVQVGAPSLFLFLLSFFDFFFFSPFFVEIQRSLVEWVGILGLIQLGLVTRR